MRIRQIRNSDFTPVNDHNQRSRNFRDTRGSWKYIEGELPDSWKRNRERTYQGQALRQLYHIVTDPKEENNVIETHPAVVE